VDNQTKAFGPQDSARKSIGEKKYSPNREAACSKVQGVRPRIFFWVGAVRFSLDFGCSE
jgi:hypothetical protein